MNRILQAILISGLIITWGCKERSHEHDEHDHQNKASDAAEMSENQVLYNEVMKIHDEVMPKMQDIHNRTKALKEKLKAASESEKKEIEAKIARLDSAGESMMTWMHEFNPIPDSAGEEKAREYLEYEMEKVRKVKENILTALEETKE